MKAVVAHGYGPPEQFTVRDVPVPRPGPGQIQVRIAAASLNPTDIRLPGGEYRAAVDLPFPHIPGNDFAGTVSEVGPGVTAFQVGDEIFGEAVPRAMRAVADPSRPSLSTGSLAEYAVFEADTPLIAHRPAGLSAPDAAAVATAGLTALSVIGSAEVKEGESVLVVGATGGVGTAVIPLLAAAGARVIATGTPADADVLRELGASEVIGYAASEYPADIDVALNLTLPEDRLAGLARTLRPGGRLITIIFPPPAPEVLGRDDVELRFLLDLGGEFGGMREVGALVVDGRLPVTISGRYTLDQGPQACVDLVRTHTLGKLIVTM
ncbi:NADP-dependent oxidoreductase [Streptomyces nigra]|uniref:NADP-dependent oxidoreductase n=1 Tax=Streptomyces nigra TaxID=1827580 RepID=UPI0036BF95FB